MTTFEELRSLSAPEPYLTIPEAAKRLGIPYSTVLRAANAGLIPVYTPFGVRMRVRLNEVIAAIEAAQVGGRNDG